MPLCPYPLWLPPSVWHYEGSLWAWDLAWDHRSNAAWLLCYAAMMSSGQKDPQKAKAIILKGFQMYAHTWKKTHLHTDIIKPVGLGLPSAPACLPGHNFNLDLVLFACTHKAQSHERLHVCTDEASVVYCDRMHALLTPLSVCIPMFSSLVNRLLTTDLHGSV